MIAKAPSSSSCSLHVSHHPLPTYLELHHVIPRAWQRFWAPPLPPFPGSYEGQELWDDRMVAACRTGHGNIHFWLVRAMRAYALLAGPEIPKRVDAAGKAARDNIPLSPNRDELKCAKLGMSRFLAAGGSLKALCDKGLWGEI